MDNKTSRNPDETSWQSELSEVLKQSFADAKAKNPLYSLRAFSKKIGLSHGALAELIKEGTRWKITQERASAILEKIDMPRSRRNKILLKMGQPPSHNYQNLAEPDHDIFLEWSYLPIIYAFDLPSEYHNPKAIAQRLGLDVEQVALTLEQLIARGFLIRDGDGSLKRPEIFFRSTDGIPSEVVARKSRHKIALATTFHLLHSLQENF